MSKDSVAPIVTGWTTAEALSKYEEDMYYAFHSIEERNSAPSEQQIAIATRLHEKLRAEARERGNLIDLPDMTKVRVLARGSFSRRFESTILKDDSVFATYWDTCLVDVTDGPMKGRKAWVFKLCVRVPDSKNPFAGQPNLKSLELNDEKPAAADPRIGSPIAAVNGDQEKPKVDVTDRMPPANSRSFSFMRPKSVQDY